MNKKKLTDIDNKMVVTRVCEERVKWVKEVKYMITEGEQTLRGMHPLDAVHRCRYNLVYLNILCY